MALKRSAVKLETLDAAGPATIREMDGWDLVRSFENQGDGPALVDLSHTPCLDIQDRDPASVSPFPVPADMNGISRKENIVVSRMNATQCQVWGLDGNLPDTDTPAATDITGGQSILALIGPDVDRVAERLAPLDIFPPGETGMRLFQAPVFHIPCQILVLDRSKDWQVVILAFARGFGQDMARTILAAGADCGLVPGGLDLFTDWLDNQ